MKFLIVGTGYSGKLTLLQLVENLDCHVEGWDERNHIGGNRHTDRDVKTGVMVHKYEPHIFKTDNERAWEFLVEYGTTRAFVNRVVVSPARSVFSMPISLLTIRYFIRKTLNLDVPDNSLPDLCALFQANQNHA